MFFLGILAILQMTLLPGLVLVKAFRLKLGTIQRLAYCFGLSLIANYAAVLLLTTLAFTGRPWRWRWWLWKSWAGCGCTGENC